MNSVMAEVEAGSQRGTRLSDVAPDCPVPQQDKAPTVDPASNPNGWLTWQRTGQRTVPARWRTRHISKDQTLSKPRIQLKHLVTCERVCSCSFALLFLGLPFFFLILVLK
jgi:hypothetical protein